MAQIDGVVEDNPAKNIIQSVVREHGFVKANKNILEVYFWDLNRAQKWLLITYQNGSSV